jgi:hypothetical protein
MISEVPLLYANKQQGRCLRYVSGENGLERVTDFATGGANSATSSSDDDAFLFSSTDHESKALVGPASLSNLSDGSFVATLPLGNSSSNSRMSVTLVDSNTRSGTTQHRMELDLNLASGTNIAKVKCFASTGNRIRVLVADARATIHCIVLTRDTLSPVSYDATSIAQILEDDYDIEYSGAELHTTMVDFLNESTAIVALAPHVLTVRFGIANDDPSLFVWSDTQVRESMSATMGSILNRAGSMLLGRVDPSNIDMAPVSALSTCCGGTNQQVVVVTTLHADSSLRQWTLDPHSRNPTNVYSINSASLPKDWTTRASPFSICLTSQYYPANNNMAATVVHIESQTKGSTLHLLQSNIDALTASATLTPLTVVPELSSIVTLSLQAQRPTLSVVGTEQALSTDDVATGTASSTSATTPHENYTHYSYAASSSSRGPLLETSPYVTPVDYTLDGVAEEEWQRMVSNSNNVMDNVAAVDSYFIKYLFRPHYPRATAQTTGPCRTSVDAALAKFTGSSSSMVGSSSSLSLEVKTLRAMQKWRRTEQQRPAATRTTRGDTSIYNSYAAVDDDDDDPMDAVTEEDDVQAHVRRWKTLLKAIWNDETKLRAPLRMDTMSSGSKSMVVLLRASGLSVLVEATDDNEDEQETDYDRLDFSALSLLQKVERERPAQLYALEAAILELVTSLSLVVDNDDTGDLDELLPDLKTLGLWAQAGSLSRNQQLISKMSPTVIQEYLDTAPMEIMLPGLSSNSSDDRMMSLSGARATPDVRHAAGGLVVRGVDAMRRLDIGRCLLLLAHYDDGTMQKLVFFKYMHTLATLWAMGQYVPMPASSNVQFSFGDSPPTKRLSFGDHDDAVSILTGNNQMTTALDAHILQASVPSDLSLPEIVMALAKTVLDSTFGRRRLNAGSPYQLLPELGCLPVPNKDDIASDHPRLALRLLATARDQVDLPNANMARKEAIAECLLIEANHRDADLALTLRERANVLLDPAEMKGDFDGNEIMNVYESLVVHAANITPTLEGLEAEHAMMKEVQRLLYRYVDGDIRQDVRRLCEKETVRTVLMPFFSAGGLPRMDESQQDSVKSLLQALLRLSDLMNRLSIIERRTDRLGRLGDTNALNLVTQTNRTIGEIQKLFPEEMYTVMPEYIHLWSLLFRHAEAACDWTTAHKACTSNPNQERRIKSFEQLVKGMVGAGAMGELLDLCVSVAGKDTDLYEIAADALARGNLGDRYATGSKAPDYLGCLYCLHAKDSDWKRAAQAMDLRFTEAEQALSNSTGSTNDVLAAQELSQAAIATASAILLVPDAADGYLVSGEFGPYPSITFVDEIEEVGPKSILKRGRDRQALAREKGAASGHKDDRLSRFMTSNELRARAVRSIAFETMFMDSVATPLSTSVLTRPSPGVDVATIDKLASFGFYPLAFAVGSARAACHAEKNGSSMPNGRDILHSTYSDVVCNYLVELASQTDHVSFDNDMDIEKAETTRPTLSQLQYALNEVSKTSSISVSMTGPKYGSTELLPNAMKSAVAMEMIRQIVLDQDSAATPIALEVAGCFLDYSDGALPKWLEDYLAGLGKNEGGLFGKSPKGTTRGDPSGLCTLYMKRGRYVDACNLVSKVLVGDGKERNTMAASRVPEKGDIDFVPYNKIDLLWNLVDTALRQGETDEPTKSQLRISRMKMEDALQSHFSLLKISEEGLASARALGSGI